MFDSIVHISPAAILANLQDNGLKKGGLGFIEGDVGSGRSQILCHIGIMAALENHAVLHITTTQSKEELLQSYDLLLSQIEKTGPQDLSHARLLLERNRLIHSRASLSLESLGSIMDMLAEIEINPEIILLDGVAITEKWRAISQERNINLWGLGEQAPEQLETIIQLHIEETGVRCTLRRWEGDSLNQTLRLQADTLLRTGLVLEGPPLAAECTLFSGGALGAESTFGELAEEFGMAEVNFTFNGHNQKRRRGSTLLNDRELNIGSVSLRYVSGKLNRSWDHTPLLQKVLNVLWHVVSHADQLFVVGVIQPDNTVHGGTGWSVELARRWSKEVHVYDQEHGMWLTWAEEQWIPSVPRITCRNIAGSGTRFLTPDAHQAMRELFERSF